LLNRPSITAYQDVPGWCSDIEAAALQDLVRGKEVLEIGVWKGRSTMAMVATAYSVFSVDHFEGDEFAGASNPSYETLGRFYPYKRIVTLCVGDWKQVLEHVDIHRFDVIYYDADHTYEATKDFLDAVYGYDGKLALHDVDDNPNHAGVKRALHEYITNSRQLTATQSPTDFYLLRDRLAILK
jgi:predicted O-methyltransferase YrrM